MGSRYTLSRGDWSDGAVPCVRCRGVLQREHDQGRWRVVQMVLAAGARALVPLYPQGMPSRNGRSDANVDASVGRAPLACLLACRSVSRRAAIRAQGEREPPIRATPAVHSHAAPARPRRLPVAPPERDDPGPAAQTRKQAAPPQPQPRNRGHRQRPALEPGPRRRPNERSAVARHKGSQGRHRILSTSAVRE